MRAPLVIHRWLGWSSSAALAMLLCASASADGLQYGQNVRGCYLGRQCAACAQPWYPGCPAGGYNYRLAMDYPWSQSPTRPILRPQMMIDQEYELSAQPHGGSSRLAANTPRRVGKSVKLSTPPGSLPTEPRGSVRFEDDATTRK